MTEKARKILNELKRRDRKGKEWMLFQRPRSRERALNDLNESTLDQQAQVGSRDQQMRVLNEMNQLGEREEEILLDTAAKFNSC